MLRIHNAATGRSYTFRQWIHLMLTLARKHPSQIPQHELACFNQFLATHVVLAFYFAGVFLILTVTLFT